MLQLLVPLAIAAGGAAINAIANRNKRAPQAVNPQDPKFQALLQQQAMGQGPSVTALQAKSSIEDSNRAAMALAASSRSPSIAMAQRQGVMQALSQQSEIARAAQVGRIEEQRAAQQQYAGLLGHNQQTALVNEQAQQQYAQQQQAARKDNIQTAVGGLAGAFNTYSAMGSPTGLSDQQQAGLLNQNTQLADQLAAEQRRRQALLAA